MKTNASKALREYFDVGEMKARVLRHGDLHNFHATIIAGVIKRKRFDKLDI
jgi:hypothetical protein